MKSEHETFVSNDGLKVYLMCEIPSNVIEYDNFAPLIDGVSIGGNDLLQLIAEDGCEAIALLNVTLYGFASA